MTEQQILSEAKRNQIEDDLEMVVWAKAFDTIEAAVIAELVKRADPAAQEPKAMTPWFPPTTKPARDGLYLRDYTGTPEGGWHFDYWLLDGNVGFWYVNEPKGEWNDAWYEELPWRGLTCGEHLEGTI